MLLIDSYLAAVTVAIAATFAWIIRGTRIEMVDLERSRPDLPEETPEGMPEAWPKAA